MILGKPTLRSVLDLMEADGCPYSSDLPVTISLNGPTEVLEGCGDVVDATRGKD